MRTAYIGAPFRASTAEEIGENKRRVAIECGNILKRQGENWQAYPYWHADGDHWIVPIAPHLIIGNYFSPLDAYEDARGRDLSRKLMLKCDEGWFFLGWGVTPGMMDEIKVLMDLGWSHSYHKEKKILVFKRGSWILRSLRKLTSWFKGSLHVRVSKLTGLSVNHGVSTTPSPETA
jgi:hypothetical protein